MNVVLWVLQILLALAFLAAGGMKLSQPKEKLEKQMTWTRSASPGTVKAVGAVEVLGALGLILPWATGIAKVLTPLAAATAAIVSNIEQVIEGKTATVRPALAVLRAEGHLVIEDVPGVGKTKLAKALARSIDCTVRRIQFTPDLLPSDVTGVSVYNQETRDFEFKPGAVFANIVVGDEINRASPKTQSALLECMEERQVSVDNTTYFLDQPFMVIATQNPIEMEGTYALPEAQRDRFTARVSIGYPDQQAELAMVDEHSGPDPMAEPQPVSDAETVHGLIETVRGVHLAPEVRRYAVDVVAATRAVPA